MDDQTIPNLAESVVNAKLTYYRSSLNLLRARRLISQADQAMKENFDGLCLTEVTDDDLMVMESSRNQLMLHIMTIKRGLGVIADNFAAMASKTANNQSIQELSQKIQELCAIIHSVRVPRCRQLHRERLNFHTLLLRYIKQLRAKADAGINRTTETSDTQNLIEKRAEYNLRKVNTTRVLKRFLIGAFIHDHDAYPEINSLRTSVRRDLILEDFKTTWDVAYTCHTPSS